MRGFRVERGPRCRPFAANEHTRLERIERDISQHRALYLQADLAGHAGEAEWHESEIDRLLGVWAYLHAGGPLEPT